MTIYAVTPREKLFTDNMIPVPKTAEPTNMRTKLAQVILSRCSSVPPDWPKNNAIALITAAMPITDRSFPVILIRFRTVFLTCLLAD